MYRVLRRKFSRSAFDGEGAYRYGGRWSSAGVRLVYTSEHESLALLEYFVHLAPEEQPDDLVLATADVPGSLRRELVRSERLPPHWCDPAAPPALRGIGDRFVEQGKACMLRVPSVLSRSEHNWLFNPAHPEFRRIIPRALEPIAYDRRMFQR